MMTLHRYWIEFDLSGVVRPPSGVSLGCGVTAENERSALELISKSIFKGTNPPIEKLVEDVAIADLDQKHVRPNMGNAAIRGIWFPLGYA
jgi:hypothetical protein